MTTRKRQKWDAEQIAILEDLIARKISLARSAVVLKRAQTTVQIQARKLGKPFPGVREVRANLKASMALAEARAGVRRV